MMRKALTAAAAIVLVVLAGPPPSTVSARAHTETFAPADVRVIVQAPDAEQAAAHAVRRLGGQVTQALPIVAGFAATVPAPAVRRLAAVPGVWAVTPDHVVEVASGADEFEESGNTETVNSVFVRTIGADELAKQGLTGEGVRVALVDTGVSTDMAESAEFAGRIVPVADPYAPSNPNVPCANFSGEDTCDDTFGHGTFMAGLVAGSGAASARERFRGVAPGAEIVSVKVGGADGSADVSKVLAGIQWVVSFADTYDIKVMNLALGSDSTVSPEFDPLNHAVQRAWVAGITVVVSAGNFGRGPRVAGDGTEYGTVTKPGDDPFVITVGAIDDRETPTAPEDRLPDFSSWGPTFHGLAKPDVVAPGARVVSLRAPRSVIDGLRPGLLDDTYRRGSGTSMAAAITSGLAALLLQARDGSDGSPAWRPDDVKAALIAGAQDVRFDDPRAIGAGVIHGPAALTASIDPTYPTSVLSDATGSLDGSRGEHSRTADHECDSPATLIDMLRSSSDELTAQCNVWRGGEYRDTEWTPQTWYESQWVTGVAGHNWQASTWAQGHNWQGHNWQGSSWNAQSDDEFYGHPIDGSGSYGVWG